MLNQFILNFINLKNLVFKRYFKLFLAIIKLYDRELVISLYHINDNGIHLTKDFH